jgi:hypothetical protein
VRAGFFGVGFSSDFCQFPVGFPSLRVSRQWWRDQSDGRVNPALPINGVAEVLHQFCQDLHGLCILQPPLCVKRIP